MAPQRERGNMMISILGQAEGCERRWDFCCGAAYAKKWSAHALQLPGPKMAGLGLGGVLYVDLHFGVFIACTQAMLFCYGETATRYIW